MENAQFQNEVIAVQSSEGKIRGEKERCESAAVQEQETAAGSPSCSDEGRFLNGEVAPGPPPSLRSPSPEYSDALQEQDSMGETVARKKADEVDGRRVEGVQRIVLSRDPDQMNTSAAADLGIGVRVAGGVKCEKCGRLHTMVTDVAGSLAHQLYSGLAVMEWCGHCVDGASYEEVRSVLAKTGEESSVVMMVKECRGPEAEVASSSNSSTTTTQDTAASADSLQNTTDREASYTPKSLSPSPSPIHSRTSSPSHSVTSTPSPTPPSSPNLRRKQPLKNFDPRPASINIPAFRPQGDNVVKPTFMINDIPASPPRITGPIRKYTIESFLGGAPNASIHFSLRYREDGNQLRLLLHEVKHSKKNRSKSSSARGHYFINSYLLPDTDKQGVRSCEVLSHISDLENPQFYIVSKNQLESVALRVILWETKSKHHYLVGEVLLSLSDNDVVRLQGLPSWFPMCNTDPNLPPLPTPVLPKKTKKEDIFRRVRRGTGYALASLRRPMSIGIDVLSMEGGGRLSPSSSMESLESTMKKLQGANVTMPRRVKKERRPLSGLFSNSPASTAQQDARGRGSVEQNGQRNGNNFDAHTNFSSTAREENDVTKASLSVPSSPLLSRRTAGKDNGRRKKIPGIFSVLKGSRRPATHSVDLTDVRSRMGSERGEETYTVPKGHSRRWSLSGDMKHRVHTPSPLSSSSPYTSPQHVRTHQVRPAVKTSSSRDELAPHDMIDGDTADEIVNGVPGRAVFTMDSLDTDRNTGALLSDSSWYSAEEDIKDESRLKNHKGMTGNTSGSRLVYTNSRLKKNNVYTSGKMNKTVKKSRSADDILDDKMAFEVSEPRESLVPRPLAHAYGGMSRDSSSSSLEDYNTADSRPLSGTSSSDNLENGSQDSAEQPRTIDKAKPTSAKPVSSSPKLVPLVPVRSDESSGSVDSAAPVSRWRSFEDLVGALPTKLKSKWLKRSRTHQVVSTCTSKQSPLLKRRSSEPATSDTSPPVGKVKLELTFNPDTSMIGVRLHEHTLSSAKTDLTVETHLFSRVGSATEGGQRNAISFKKTYYSHTLVASFHCDSPLNDMSLQVSLETSGRFFSRHSGHVILELGPLLLSSPSLSCDKWFPLFHSPLYPPTPPDIL